MTSTEIAIRQPRDTDSWVAMLPAVGQLAESVHRTEFVPGPLRGHAPAVAAAILAGREIGLPPLMSLQHIHIIDGRPTLSAQMQRSLAQSAGYHMQIVETTTTRCIVEGRRSSSDEWTRVTWTADDAKRAGLLGRQNWQKHPRRMLQARATAELCQLIFSDAIAGMAATEEAEDDVEGPGAVMVNGSEKPAQRTAQRRTRTTQSSGPAADEKAPGRAAAGPDTTPPQGGLPPLPGEDDDAGTAPSGQPAGQEPATAPVPSGTEPDDTDYDTPGTVTKPQLTALWTVLSKVFGFSADEKEQARTVCAQVVDRELESSADLSRNEARTVLDTLSNWQVIAREKDQPPRDVLIAQMIAADGQGSDA